MSAPRRFRTRVLGTLGTLAMLAALGMAAFASAITFTAAPAVAQSITGGCTVTFNGIDASTAHSPGNAIEVDEGDTLEVVGTAPGPISGYQVFMRFGFLKYEAKSGVVTGDDTTWSSDVEIDDYARYGVGLYRVEGASTGTECSGWAYIRVNGPFPLTTVAGGAAAVVTVAGVAGMASATRPGRGGRTPGRGHRVRGAAFGFFAGLGAAVLLQQFGVVPMTPAVMVGVPVGVGMIGAALGWPKVAAAVATGAA